MTDRKKSGVITITKRSSKKQMQESLKNEIERIDAKLSSLGLPPNIVYNIQSAVQNHETSQNTVNIQTITDINYIYRALAYYENMYNSILSNSESMFGVADTEIRNPQGFLVRDIISDLKLRLRVIKNHTIIQTLNEAKQKLAPFLDEDTRLYNTIKEVTGLYQNLLK